MNGTRLALTFDGIEWETWERLLCRRSIDDIVHEMEAETSDPNRRGPARWDLNSGSELTMTLDNDVVFRGFIERYSTSKSTGSVSTSARNRAKDLVECGHEGPYFWRNVPAADVVTQVLAPYGFPVRIDADLGRIGEEGYRVAVDARAYEIIRRLAERAGAVIRADRSGTIRIGSGIDPTPVQPLGPCDYSELRLRGTLNSAYSRIVIKYQANDLEQDDDTTQSEQLVFDNPAAPRYRPLVIIETSKDAARRRFGQYVARRVTGETLDAVFTVHSHRRPDGAIWDPGQLIDAEDDEIGLRDRLVVHTVELEIGEDGGLIKRVMARIPQSYDGDVTGTDIRRAEAFAPVVGALREYEVI